MSTAKATGAGGEKKPKFFIGNKISVTLAAGIEQRQTYIGEVVSRAANLYRVMVDKRGTYLQIDLDSQQASFLNSQRVFQVIESEELRGEIEQELGLVEKSFEKVLTGGEQNANLRMSEGQSKAKSKGSSNLLEKILPSLKETTSMAMINLSALPVATRGKVATEKKVAIRENGQIQLNSLASKEVEDLTKVGFDWDAKTRNLTLVFGDDTLANSLPVNRGKEGDATPTLSAAGVLRHIGFDYAAGNKLFSEGEKNLKIGKTKAGNIAIVLMALEDGERPKQPKQERQKKAKATATATATPAAPADDTIDTDAIL